MINITNVLNYPFTELKIIKKSSDIEVIKKPRKPVPCELCNKTFISSMNLENHKQKCHPGKIRKIRNRIYIFNDN